MPPHRVGVFAPFWSEIHFAHFGLESGWELRSVWAYLSFQFQMSKKEREICELEMDE